VVPAKFVVGHVKLIAFAHKLFCGVTAMEIVVVLEQPAALVAVMVYVVAACVALGVPEMTPVLGSIVRPAGKLGLTAKDVGEFVMLGVKLLIAAFCANVYGVPG
jgi:hypothetical protein